MQAHVEKRLAGPTCPDRGGPGILVLVVGPSGAGKDSLIDAARTLFSGNSRFAFPTRSITRPEAAGERHDAVPPERFAAEEAAGRFLLTWRSHGLAYAIPATISEALASGRIVVVNVSRTVVRAAEAMIDNVVVLHVTASAEVRAARIRARGREDADAQAARLERGVAVTSLRSPVIEIVNDSALEEAVASFTQALEKIASGRAVQTGQ